MKAAICLASLAIMAGVITAAPFAWDHDTVYTYQVNSRFAAGLVGLSGPTVDDTQTDRAIVQITWKVDIYRTHEPNTIFMNPRNFRAIVTREQIHPRVEPISSQKETAIPQKYQDLLTKVMIVKIDPKSGVPESIVVRADQPLTTNEKNLKRAQLQSFILNPGTSKLVVKGNTQRATNSVRQSEQDDDSGFFYKVMEESIHGECQTYYHVSQTGPFQSLYQNEAQDVPVPAQDDQDSSGSDEQQRTRNPRFAAFQQQQMQQQQQQQWKTPQQQQQQWTTPQQQQQWKTQQKQQWSTQHQQQQWQTQHQQQQWQTRQNQNENEINQDAQQQPWPQAFQQYCDDNDQVYIIQKTVNLTACRDRPVLATMIPAQLLNCRPGDNSCGSLWNHVVNTRFVACGKSRQDFTIVEANQQEHFVHGDRTDENIDGSTLTNVTLQQKERTSSNPAAAEMKQQGQNEYTIHSLVFEFDLNDQRKQLGGEPQQQWQQHQQQQQQWQQQSSSNRRRNQQQQNSNSDSSEEDNAPQGTNGPIQFPLQNQQPSLEQPPLRPQLITTVASQAQLQKRSQELIQEAALNVHDPRRSITEGETISLQSVAAKCFTYMSKQQHLKALEEARQQNAHDPKLQEIVVNMHLDAWAASGTNPSLVALMELIEQEQITHPKAPVLVMTFAHYCRHPTPQFLERFDQFIQHPTVQNNEQVRTAAMLSQSSLLHQACMNARTKQSSFSYSLYGPFCQPEDTEKYVDQHIRALQKALKKSNKEFKNQGGSRNKEISLRLACLGNIGHPKIIKPIQQILDDSNDPEIKTKAIYALKNLIRSHEENNPIQHHNGNVNTDQNQNEVDRVESDPITNELVENKVLPILMSVSLDKSEHQNVRVAAITLTLYCTSADVTVWQALAVSTQSSVNNEVHNFIYTSITNLADLEVAPTRQHNQMIVKARSVRPLLQPLDNENAGRSTNTFASGRAQHLNAEFFSQISWTGSPDSPYPTSFYYRNSRILGSGAVGVTPLEFSFHMRTLQKVADKIQDAIGSSSSEESGEKNQYMKKILDNITTRQMKEAPNGALYVNVYNDMQALFEIDQYLQTKNYPFNAALRQGVPFNIQKTVQLSHQTMVMPTILGLPMSFKLRVPAMVSVRGKAKLNGGPSQGQFHAQVDAFVGYKRVVKVSLQADFIDTKLESGVQSHFAVQIPLRITIRHRSDEPVIVAITPTANINGTASGKIELVTFHRKPYVAVITDELYPTVHRKGGQMTLIRTLDAPTTNENNVEDVLGFALQSQESSDYREESETSEGWARYLSNFQNGRTFAHLGSYGGPVAKYANRKLILNVDESQTKTVILMLAAKRGSGSLAEGFDTDVSSSSSSSSSTSESDSSYSSDSSSEEKNQQQNNRQARQQNQQSSSSSSSSSSESNEASNSNENSQEVLSKGRVIVLAVVTKKEEIPPVSRSGGVVDLLKSENANQHQYIAQLSKRSDKLFFRYAQGAAAEEAARSLPSNSNSLQKLANSVINPDYQGQQTEFCSELSAKINYPKYAHPRLLVALRDALLNNELKVDVAALAQFAHTCKNEDLKQNEISMNGQLQRSQNMTEYAKSKSQEAQQCEQDENQGFSVSDDCLTVSIEQASALNKARLSFKWSDDLPQPLQQAVYKAQDMVKAAYQPHVSHDRFPQNPANGNSAIVNLRISPDSEYWSAIVLTNETELQIQNVPSNAAIQAALPLSAIQSVAQNIQDSILGDGSQPTCQLEGNTISSFDNVVDQIDTNVAQGCYHLLTADGSGKDTMAVLAKNLGTDNVKLQLILSQNKIQLSSQRSVPRARLSQIEQANDIVATVNGQSVALPFTIRKQGQRGESNDYVARIQPHPSGGVQVLTPKNDIAFDGSKIIIFADDIYRNKTVGLCGDFNGEQVADRRSRKDIPLSSATLLYANYAYDAEGNQCQVNQQAQEQIKQEESLAKISRKSRNVNGNQNLRWGQTWTRSQQRNAWQNRPLNQNESSSSSSEESQSQHSSHSGQGNNRQPGRH